MASESSTSHGPITGGCLCKAVRYTITFPESTWPPSNNCICHCTQCRKATGALMSHIVSIDPKQIQWACEDRSFREYSSSSGVFRGFCQNCGSTLTWRNVKTPNDIDIFTGTLDEEALLGGDGETAKALLTAPAQFWCENIIKGVSDGAVGGTKFVKDRNHGVVTDG